MAPSMDATPEVKTRTEDTTEPDEAPTESIRTEDTTAPDEAPAQKLRTENTTAPNEAPGESLRTENTAAPDEAPTESARTEDPTAPDEAPTESARTENTAAPDEAPTERLTTENTTPPDDAAAEKLRTEYTTPPDEAPAENLRAESNTEGAEALKKKPRATDVRNEHKFPWAPHPDVEARTYDTTASEEAPAKSAQTENTTGANEDLEKRPGTGETTEEDEFPWIPTPKWEGSGVMPPRVDEKRGIRSLSVQVEDMIHLEMEANADRIAPKKTRTADQMTDDPGKSPSKKARTADPSGDDLLTDEGPRGRSRIRVPLGRLGPIVRQAYKEKIKAAKKNGADVGAATILNEEIVTFIKGFEYFPPAKYGSSFISSRGNEYFCEIDEDYLTDRFNLTGLNTDVQYYQYALDLVTDVFDLDCDEDMREQIENSARHLYGLVHARYITTTRGLAKMCEKYKKGDFGKCPRVMCQSHPLLPTGMSDVPHVQSVKLFCGKCEDLYNPKSSRHANIDGAYFGTSFQNILFQVYPNMIPEKSTQRYQPKIFGFKVHAAAALERWQTVKREEMQERLRERGFDKVFKEDLEVDEQEEDIDNMDDMDDVLAE